ncbi:MAG: Hsp33 family molecular chaperone HslO, partial [Victivallaceae bacterium]|nr:Hsp33 family molecular chaperone HslO [Victivallaceae bacterium]
MKDFLFRSVSGGALPIRAAAGSMRELAAEAIVRHDCDPVAGRLLADGMISAALLSCQLDEGDRYSVRIDYPEKSAAGNLIFEVDSTGNVRGFVACAHIVEAGGASVDAACGDNARVRMTRCDAAGRVLHSGESRSAFVLPSEALCYFLSVSDQVESAMQTQIEFRPDIEFPVASAKGMLIQALPGCDLAGFDQVRNRLVSPAGRELLAGVADADGVETLLNFVTGEKGVHQVFAAPTPRFHCRCSAESMRRATLGVLGQADFDKLLKENPDATV